MNRWFWKRLSPIVAASIFVFAVSSCDASAAWPVIQKFNGIYHFVSVAKAGVDIPIKDKSGKPVYMLKCHSGLYDKDPDFDYSGLLDCRLISLYSKEKVSTLFTETQNQQNDWENRGRFLAEHLRSGCAEYPDWGSRRSFYVRGMKIILFIYDVAYEKSATGKRNIQSYSLAVHVKNDKNAKTAITRRSKVPEPPWFYHPDISCSK